MRWINRVELLGEVATEVTMLHSDTNLQGCAFRLVTYDSWKGNDFTVHEEWYVHSLVAWGKLAEICLAHVDKHAMVYVVGRLHYRTSSTDGQEVSVTTDIIIEDIILLDHLRYRDPDTQEVIDSSKLLNEKPLLQMPYKPPHKPDNKSKTQQNT